MKFDPFAADYNTEGMSPDSISSSIDTTGTTTVPSDYEPVRYADEPFEHFPLVSGYWAYDLEAIPDESRFPRPAVKEILFDESLDMEEVLKTESSLKKRLKDGVCPEQLLLLQEKEQSRERGPRKGVSEALVKNMEEGDKAMREWHHLGTRPETARIVAMSVCAFGEPNKPRVWLAETEDEERQLVQDFFDLLYHKTTRVGYNIAGYDDRLIFWRAMRLGVTPDERLSLHRYGGRNSLDLMIKLFGGVANAVKLKTLLSWLDIHPPAGDTDGSEVLEMVDSGNWGALQNYVASDAWSELQLLVRIQQVLELS